MQNKSPSTQRTDFNLRAVKTDDNIEIRARQKEDFWYATDGDAKDCNQEETSVCSGQTPV